MKFALAGNQNCGKTALFNALTGMRCHVGNFPGVTVEQKTGEIKGKSDCTVVDLPGIYSLRPYTQEEIVTRDYILNEKPDCIINIIDATNIERNLYLSMQLLELKINNPEIGEWKRFDRVNEYIERGISEIEEKINSLPSTQVKGWDELNNLFLSFID